MSIELNKPEYVIDCDNVELINVSWYVFRKEYVKSVFGFVKEKATKVYSASLVGGYEECEVVVKAIKELEELRKKSNDHILQR